jgi:hypothetical protein
VEGILPALAYLGTAITAIGAIRAIARLITNSATVRPQLPANPVTFQTLWRLAKHLYREEVIILGVFVLTSVSLVAKYFAGWNGPPGYFLEFINLLCIINFWIHFRLTDLSTEQVAMKAPV